MEKIEAELKEAETKQRSLSKAYECVHAQAAALIIFAVQWKDLEEHFESTRYSLESRFRELAHRETAVRVRDEELAEKEMKFYTEVESKADELGRIQILIDEKAEEVIQSKNHLQSLQSLILEHNDEVMVQEKRLMEVESFVGEKKRECDSIERRVKERMKKLNWVERMVEEKSKLAELKAETLRGFEAALEKCVEKTELKERELNEIIGSIEERKEEFSWIGEQILEAEKLIKVQEQQLDLKEEKFKEAQKAVEECDKELKLRAERIKEAERAVEECDKELKMKKEKLSAMEKSLVECSNAMESRETKIREMDSKKDKDFCLRERSLEEWSCKLEFKERELVLKERNVELKAGELRKSKEEGEKYLESLSQGLKEKENQLQGLDKELRLKQKELDLIKKSTQERAKDLELKERQLEDQAKECSLKQIEFNSIKKFTEERSQNLELKERQLEDQAKELELKQKEFDSIKKFSEERSQKLNLKKRQLEDRAKELELKHKEFDSLRKFSEEHTQNLKAKENTSILLSQVKIEQLEHIPANNVVLPSRASNQSSVNMDGRGLLLFINEHLKNYVLVGSEISAVLQVSPDPAKLVLDSMQGFYHSNSRADKSGCGFDLSITRVSCILLLETLKSISPKINPEVKEEAIKLAGDWKVKMTTGTENCLDVLCFLRFVSTYGITSFYDAIQSLCAIVAEDEHTTELSCALGISDKAPAKTETPESLLAKNAGTFSSPNLQLSATTDASHLQGVLNEIFSRDRLLQNETWATFQMSSDPEKFVMDVMQTSFAKYCTVEDVGFRETVMSKCISLLDKLMRIKPHVGPHVNKDALKLAVHWKSKIGAGTQAFELLGFLQFIATYGLLSMFNKEILVFLGRISQQKQALEACQTLGLADKIPADFIRNLIEKKQLIEAVRLICPFKLIDKFHPVPLLKEFVENAKRLCIQNSKRSKSLDEKDKCINNQIADLRVVIQCIKGCNLEFEYPSRFIETRIAFLEKLKEDRRRPKTSPPSKVEQHNQKNSPVSKVEQQEQKKASASKVEGQEQKMSAAPKGAGQEQKKSPSSRVEGQEHIESLASNVKQGAAKPLASIVEGREQTISVPSKVEPEHHRSGQKVEGQEQKKSHASRVEGQEQKKSAASKGAAQEQKKSPSSNVEQGAEKPPASTVEQEQHRRGQKRRPNTLPRQFQPQQQRQSKYHRTSESIGPGYRKPSLWHENHRHRGQFGRDANSYEIGANAGTGFTAIPNPRPCVPH
ncbi:FRIGIDA-like protein 5 isoform X1 [Malus sylvestris]|uniref:FRIGIDA-like protein 5 isoform X1 n=1 Tax=Malus sylvestris TaxID=3752 RepID=UPI0021ABC98C|nr:FRIGIDA-like protein 5 isoform X1 [Malus sylvestris]